MGLDYSYMLYFQRDQLEKVLQGITNFAEKHDPPTRILFPDHILEIPLESGPQQDRILRYDEPELGFATVLIFEEDDAILDWGHGQEIAQNSNFAEENKNRRMVSVGYIYLTVYNDLSEYYPEINLDLQDLVLFNFGTTGTRMSQLFYYSSSIRDQFTQLMREYNGICGVFNMEDDGEVFWLNGKPTQAFIEDVWTSPAEIIKKLSNQ